VLTEHSDRTDHASFQSIKSTLPAKAKTFDHFYVLMPAGIDWFNIRWNNFSSKLPEQEKGQSALLPKIFPSSGVISIKMSSCSRLSKLSRSAVLQVRSCIHPTKAKETGFKAIGCAHHIVNNNNNQQTRHFIHGINQTSRG